MADGLLKNLANELRKYAGNAFGGSLNPEWTPERAKMAAGLLADVTPVVGDIKAGYEAIDSARQGNYGEAALNAVGVLPFIPSMGGVIKNGTVDLIPWAKWQQEFKAIPVNESYEMWKSYAGNRVSGEAQELVNKLKEIGIKAEKENPYPFHNAIGGVSSYNNIPGFGEVRISDHFRGSGLGNNRTFGTSNDAFDAIKEQITKNDSRIAKRNALRDELGIGSNGNENFNKVKAYAGTKTGKEKDVGYWINELGLQVGKFNPNRYLPE